jgi:hypothetical protein
MTPATHAEAHDFLECFFADTGCIDHEVRTEAHDYLDRILTPRDMPADAFKSAFLAFQFFKNRQTYGEMIPRFLEKFGTTAPPAKAATKRRAAAFTADDRLFLQACGVTA